MSRVQAGGKRIRRQVVYLGTAHETQPGGVAKKMHRATDHQSQVSRASSEKFRRARRYAPASDLDRSDRRYPMRGDAPDGLPGKTKRSQISRRIFGSSQGTGKKTVRPALLR